MLETLTHTSRILIGLSGGADSVYLTQLLTKRVNPKQMLAVYFNHGLRPKEDISNDISIVSQVCNRFQIPYKVILLEIKKNTQKESIETTARNLRRHHLYTMAKKLKYHYIALGHHLDDHIETALFQLIRGTQSQFSGINSISYLQEIPIIRPLLHLSKQEIIEQLTQQNIPFSTDITNKDLSYTRNKIRHQLIPIIEEINPNYKHSIAQLLTYQVQAQGFIQEQLKDSIKHCIITPKTLLIPSKIFHSLSAFLQSNWIRFCIKKWIQTLPLEINAQFNAIHITNIAKLFSKDTNKKCSVPQPFQVQKTSHGVLISAKVDKN